MTQNLLVTPHTERGHVALSTSSSLTHPYATEDISRQQLVKDWLRKVRESRNQFFGAAESYQRMKLELAQGVVTEADEKREAALAIARARRSKSFAWAQYKRLLRTYKDLVLKGLPPSGDDGL